MRSPVAAGSRERTHILVYDPRTEGHHVSYLKFISEDLLYAGYRLTLAIDASPASFARIRSELGSILDRVTVLSLRDHFGHRLGKRSSSAVAKCLARSGAEFVLLPNFDEIASRIFRGAALGIMPRDTLRGRLAGIYFRPRFFAGRGISPNQWLIAAGFSRMLREHWLKRLFLLDPYICADFKSRSPDAPISYLPDPYPDDFAANRQEARREFQLETQKRVFLFYGAGYRRKGLPLVLSAMEPLPNNSPAMLLCAGQHLHDPLIVQRLAALEAAGKARVIARYVSTDEEKKLFAASDVVLLPYRRHEGSSGVMVRAIGAGLPVVASDERLMGRLVRDLGLGLLFSSGDASALRECIIAMAKAGEDQMTRWRAAARATAPQWSRSAFRQALLGGLDEMSAFRKTDGSVEYRASVGG